MRNNKKKKSGKEIPANLGQVAANAYTKTKDIATKTQKSIVGIVDKNGNSRIDMADFGLGAENLQKAKERVEKITSFAGQSIKNGSDTIGQVISNTKIEMDRKNLRPVFAEDFYTVFQSEHADLGVHEVKTPKIIRLVVKDKKRSESEACFGSVGYWTTVAGVEILNLYEDCIPQLKFQFYPNITQTVYYADPYQSNFYIDLDEYFSYLKKARVSELERIAQNLGAKRVQISFKERKNSLIKKDGRIEEKVESIKLSGTHSKANSEYFSIEIAADVKFSGHDIPVKAPIVYFKNESDIEKLVQMRMGDAKNQIKSKTYRFQCSQSSGMTEKDAAQLDAVLKQMKYVGTASISSEAQRESRTELEYSIEF